MSDPVEDVVTDVSEVFDKHVKRFLAWAAVEWTVGEAHRNDEVFGPMSDEAVEAYNTAVNSMADAYSVWREEFPIS